MQSTVVQEGSKRNKWIESTFKKRECYRYMGSAEDDNRCCCGRELSSHRIRSVERIVEPDEMWRTSRNTISSPTDAYGTIDFLEGPHPNKAQYIRIASDSRSDHILQLMTKEWGLGLPKLVISVHGGKANFELNNNLKTELNKGLLKTAKTTGAWILTDGINAGITRHVGDALVLERSPRLRSGRVVSIGITPWGVVENRQALIGQGKDVKYFSVDRPRSRYAVLNNRHVCFLLVDNGSVGRYGAEVIFRRKLERYLSSQQLTARGKCSIPVVCVVIEGGMHTIRQVLEYVTDSPPVPVVICEGSGRAADLLALTFKFVSENSDLTPAIQEQLIAAIQSTFKVGIVRAKGLYRELLQCVTNSNLITIFRISGASLESNREGHDLDRAILSSLIKSRHLSAAEQLRLALAWNRVDIARSDIFVYGHEWSVETIEEAMMDALSKNRVDFVKLFLEIGIEMANFLTIPRLEELYNSKDGPSNTLRYIVRDVHANIPADYSFTLIDIGLVINKLMGIAYRSLYTRREFRSLYQTIMKDSEIDFAESAIGRIYRSGKSALTIGEAAVNSNENLKGVQWQSAIFRRPFNELFLWAVLTKRQSMAKLMWHHGEEALPKALAANKLFRAMAKEAKEDDLEVEISAELRSYAVEFETYSLELLDYSYRQDADLTEQLITSELVNWSRQTCLQLAFNSNHQKFLAHPCPQLIMADLWMGALQTRHWTNLRVALSLFCPLLILHLEFKSKEALQLMPQTEEEHMFEMESELSDNEDKSSSSSSSYVSLSSYPNYTARSAESISQKGDVCDMRYDLNLCHQREQMAMQQMSQADLPCSNANVRRRKQLRKRKKIYEFYTAPITKFWSHFIFYIAFLMIYTYMVLVKLPSTPVWYEYYVAAYITTFSLEIMREIYCNEPDKLRDKFSFWLNSWGNCCDVVGILGFFIGLILRLHLNYLKIGRILYCLNIVYWYIRLIRFLTVYKFLGVIVTVAEKLLKIMMSYIFLLAIILVAYGVFRQALLYPTEEASWMLARNVFYKPYLMIYGELSAGSINPECGPDKEEKICVTGRWLNPLMMTIYLLVSIIVIVNILVAVFNQLFLEAVKCHRQIWKFNRLGVLLEYEHKPVLPPPLIIFSHIYFIVKACLRRARGMKDSYSLGLKLFLNDDDLERLNDFEEESMEGLAREKEAHAQLSIHGKVRVIEERLDIVVSKIEGPVSRLVFENQQEIDSLNLRMTRLQELAQLNRQCLDAIQRSIVQSSDPNAIRQTLSLQCSPKQSILSNLQATDLANLQSAMGSRFGPISAANYSSDKDHVFTAPVNGKNTFQLKVEYAEQDNDGHEKSSGTVIGTDPFLARGIYQHSTELQVHDMCENRKLIKKCKSWPSIMTDTAPRQKKGTAKNQGEYERATNKLAETDAQVGEYGPNSIATTCCQFIQRTNTAFRSFNTTRSNVMDGPISDYSQLAQLSLIAPKNALAKTKSIETAQVKAEADHLRQLEGEDYHMMADIFRLGKNEYQGQPISLAGSRTLDTADDSTNWRHESIRSLDSIENDNRKIAADNLQLSQNFHQRELDGVRPLKNDSLILSAQQLMKHV